MVRFCLKVSRPGLWFPTIWLYLLPTVGHNSWLQIPFWLGLLYVTFPLNFLVYGWNDMVDESIDQFNPRKDSYFFGAKGKIEELRSLPHCIIGTQLVFWPVLAYFSSWHMVITLLGIVFFCWIYNAQDWGLRSQPPFELACQIGYLLILPLSCILNTVPFPEVEVWVYLFLFCAQSQLIGEVMDIGPDRKGGRRTIATELGRQNTKLLIIAIVLLEAMLIWAWFADFLFALGLSLFALWLVLDRFLLYRDREYTDIEFLIFGLASNTIACFSMIYVWKAQVFVAS